MDKMVYFYETTKHKLWVLWYVLMACVALIRRAIMHDLSKYSPIEADGFIKMLPRLKVSTYGSEEYHGLLEELKPTLDHHYSNNRHHPEYFGGTIHAMTPIDVIEMLCDWRAAVRRHANGDMAHSLGVNSKRFEMTKLEAYAIAAAANEIGLL